MDDLMLRMLHWSRQGYSCSQILLLLALEARGESNPGLVRSMAGLAYGCGSGRATCGTLTGGCCLLAYLAADDGDAARPSEKLPILLQELSDWFGERVGQAHGGTSCDLIVGEAGPAAARQKCGDIVAETYGKIMQIVAEHGIA